MAKRSVKKKRKLEELKEEMQQQKAPEKSEDEKKRDALIGEIMQKRKEEEEAKAEEVIVEKEETPEDERSIKEQQMEELMEQRKFDVCPLCGQHAMAGAVQPKIPFPIGDRVLVMTIPLLVCTNCTTAYMPKSFLNQLLNPQEVEKPKIITLE